MTYSDKYALLKAYKMITGDDPDQKISEEENWSDKVTDIEAKTIYSLLKKKEINLNNFLEFYGISNTNELTKKQYAEALEKLR